MVSVTSAPTTRRPYPLSMLLALSLWIGASPQAQADGQLLQRACSAVEEFQRNPEQFDRGRDLGYCLGLLKGVREMNDFYEKKAPQQAYFCLDGKKLANQEAASLVLNYLQRHPQHLHRPETVLAIQAFRDAYPCAAG